MTPIWHEFKCEFVEKEPTDFSPIEYSYGLVTLDLNIIYAFNPASDPKQTCLRTSMGEDFIVLKKYEKVKTIMRQTQKQNCLS